MISLLCGNWVRSRRTDRKSTRLNSSHLVISYAVFCLKKKLSSLNRLPMKLARKCNMNLSLYLREMPVLARVGRMAIASFFFNDTATTEIYTLSLHDALPIYKILAGFAGPTADALSLFERFEGK